MLITSDFARDVMCNELVEISKCIDRLDEKTGIKQDMMQHVLNLKDIMIGPDFVYVSIDVWSSELDSLAEAIVKERGVL